MKKIALTLFLLLFSQVAFSSFSSALNAYQGGDYRAAAIEFERLANRNDADAQYMLGYMYALGEGVPQDYINAHKWLNLAASQGKEGAREAREQVSKRMSRKQISRAQQMARAWKPVQRSNRPTLTFTTPKTSRVITSPSTVMEIQRRLGELGYNPGPADGAPGQRTRNAIRNYQIDNKLKVNGQITKQLLNHLIPGYIDTPRWRYDDIWSAPNTKPSMDTIELIDDLQTLIDQIKSKQAADRWVLRELRQLVRKNLRAWTRVLLDEKFTNRRYRMNKNLKITSGRFHLQPGAGLQSQAVAKLSRKEQRKELAAALLNSFLGGDTRHLRKRQAAQITNYRKTTNAFAARARFGAIENNTRITFMMSKNDKRDTGYRLILDTDGKRDEITMIRLNKQGKVVIDGYRGRLGLANGRGHTLEWTRNKSGLMKVAIDGKEILRVTDSGIRKGFSQMSITNIGGNYILRNLMLLDAG